LPEEGGNKNSKHSNSLRLNELIIAVAGLLETGGLFGVLLPYSRTEYFEKEAIRAGLFTSEKLLVRHSTKHDYFRAILVLERKQIAVQQSELSVKNITNEYSNEFIDLLKDYYLYL
jgi:tRNA1Val (adenine37-N6)-methyltransferase